MRLLICVFFLNLSFVSAQNKACSIFLHGGAGNFTSHDLSNNEAENYRNILDSLVSLGYNMLVSGKSSLDVVETIVSAMEDSPLFNAGKGAVFTHEGKNELDASIMDGKTLNAGAVAGVSNIQNPVKLARMVKDSSAHVLFSGPGAQKFAIEIGLDTVPDDYFYTDKAWQSLQKKLEKEGKNGTVGCVARDLNGNLAAATSTGGMTNKKHGRIGDSPIIGAGTYADNRYAGVSCTGHGEFFICNAIAYDIIAQMKYTNANIETALQNCIKTLSDQNANGGIIAIDSEGNINSNCNTSGMFRAYVDKNGTKTIRLYK